MFLINSNIEKKINIVFVIWEKRLTPLAFTYELNRIVAVVCEMTFLGVIPFKKREKI